MFSSAIWWKWPTIQSVLWTIWSKAIVALMTPDRPERSQLTRPRKSAVDAAFQVQFER
jgi:hypothetical protein